MIFSRIQHGKNEHEPHSFILPRFYLLGARYCRDTEVEKINEISDFQRICVPRWGNKTGKMTISETHERNKI